MEKVRKTRAKVAKQVAPRPQMNAPIWPKPWALVISMSRPAMIFPKNRNVPVANPTMEKAVPLMFFGMVVEIRALRLHCVMDMCKPTRK